MMTKLAAIDIGGTSIKFALWDGTSLQHVQHQPTPKTLPAFYAVLQAGVKAVCGGEADVAGVAISSPGSVNKQTGVIEGASAIPYIHNFPIQPKLEALFGLPVSLENDANCAALAELAAGAGVGKQSLLFLVIGTGVGGAVVIDGKIWHGAHLYGGEFGYMLMHDGQTLSNLVSPVSLSKRFSAKVGHSVSGKAVFELAEAGDVPAQQAVQEVVDTLGQAIFNLQYAFDPELVVIGGAISANDHFLAQVRQSIAKVKATVEIGTITPQLVPCAYLGEANLRGAVADFLQAN